MSSYSLADRLEIILAHADANCRRQLFNPARGGSAKHHLGEELQALLAEFDPPDRPPLRPPLHKFSIEMEKALRRNDHKDGWESDTFDDLLVRVKEETEELEGAIADVLSQPTTERVERLIREAADVANFAMMIADNCRRGSRR